MWMARCERPANTPFSVHIKIDTGLARNAFSLSDLSGVGHRLGTAQAEGELHVEGVFPHLSGTSPTEDERQCAH